MARRGKRSIRRKNLPTGSDVGEAFDNFTDGGAEPYVFDAKTPEASAGGERNNRTLGTEIRDGVPGAPSPARWQDRLSSRANRPDAAYFRAAQAYMLISMPTGTSTIFGAFQVIRASQG
jgi:hypothetical protein